MYLLRTPTYTGLADLRVHIYQTETVVKPNARTHAHTRTDIHTYRRTPTHGQAVRPFAKKLYGKKAMEMSQAELYSFFLTRVRSNLHIVLAFSPIGDAFRDRLRKFPSLINCCAIGKKQFPLLRRGSNWTLAWRIVYSGDRNA